MVVWDLIILFFLIIKIILVFNVNIFFIFLDIILCIFFLFIFIYNMECVFLRLRCVEYFMFLCFKKLCK